MFFQLPCQSLLTIGFAKPPLTYWRNILFTILSLTGRIKINEKNNYSKISSSLMLSKALEVSGKGSKGGKKSNQTVLYLE